MSQDAASANPGAGSLYLAVIVLLVDVIIAILAWGMGYQQGHFDGEVKVWKIRDEEWDRNHGI